MRKQNPYTLPDDVRQQAIGALRGYHRLRQQLAGMDAAAAPDSEQGVRRMLIHGRLVAMDRAIAQIPEEYRKGLLDKLWYHAPYPYIAGEATWKRQRRKLLYYTAKYLAIP
ncbi:MAG: hypothetical protein IJY28_02090 [Clostridia bacterium]|nr:hypothetical protein [Clostridia bacterium]